MSKRSNCHASEDQTIARDADIYQMTMEIDADYECVKVYKVYMIFKTHLIEELGLAKKGFPKDMTTKPQPG